VSRLAAKLLDSDPTLLILAQEDAIRSTEDALRTTIRRRPVLGEVLGAQR
jgi:hypothetical protein